MRLRDAVHRRLPLIAATAAVAVAFPVGVIASHSFSDVSTTHPFHADIAALKDSGVSTTGCGGGEFCPEENVTRGQMAAFLNRLGALGPGKAPVVNADKVDGKEEVLGAGDIVVPQRGLWAPYGNDAITVRFDLVWTRIVSSGSGQPVAVLPLDAPGTIDGQAYGVKSVEVCYGASAGVEIEFTEVYETLDSSYSVSLSDDTVRSMTADGCFTVTDPSVTALDGAAWLSLTLDYALAATANIGTVRTTWTPVG